MPSGGQLEVPAFEFLPGGIDHIAGKPDPAQIRIRIAEPFQQVETAVNNVVGVLAAVAEEPACRNIDLEEPGLMPGCGSPGQEAFGVHARISPPSF
jgi:hypothetical protein